MKKVKLQTKKINFKTIIFFLLSIFTFKYLGAVSSDVMINQVVDNKYSAGLSYSTENTIYPVNYKAPVIFIYQEPVAQNSVQNNKVKPTIPSGYFVPNENQFVVVVNVPSAKPTENAENDKCLNVSGIQTKVEKGWIQNSLKECFLVVQQNSVNVKSSSKNNDTQNREAVITFSFIPEKYIYPVDSPALTKVFRKISSGKENKNFINDPNPSEQIKIDLIGAVIYILLLLIACILALRVMREFYKFETA